ncbi:MAG TPA: HAD family phosphatase [Bryobacteraceae bacterium]|jgi:HAD superfamily hydrolase (TIGR01509 family)|nr:HAD family phosphatase [Bryobacteraceae bacterium]
MPIEAVIFDMDGLMLDTEPFYRAAWQRAARECGYEISDELWFDFVGRTRAGGEDLMVQLFGAGFPLEAFRAASLRTEKAVFAEAVPAKKPGLDRLLGFLDLRGLPCAVATSTDRNRATEHLSSHRLLDRFNVMATGDEVEHGKPAPDLFLLAAGRLAVAPANCLVLEDSEAGVLAAHHAGMRIFIVPDLRLPSAVIEQMSQGTFDSLFAVEDELRRLFTPRP